MFSSHVNDLHVVSAPFEIAVIFLGYITRHIVCIGTSVFRNFFCTVLRIRSFFSICAPVLRAFCPCAGSYSLLHVFSMLFFLELFLVFFTDTRFFC